MAIGPSQRLGPYEILSAIGAGGMGEVYRARDTRLDRVVAIKILPDHQAVRPELRERFEREARTIASLNHPHICTLHDIGQQDRTDFLVMEYLEGETLAERLKKGPLALDQVLRYAIEIADALDKAHRKGITHRDLKPGNIMLTKSGAKLLDFGLAKLTNPSAVSPLSQLPTVNDAITQQGTILGTLQYMAPEQLEGKEADSRTDIFAFGVVVYEMATGKKAFEGKTQASLIAKILETDPPPISSLQPMTPPALDRVVKKCLAKEPEKRWQNAIDLCDELKWIAESGSQVAPSLSAPTKSTSANRQRVILGSSVACLIVASIVGLVVWNLKPAAGSAGRQVSRAVIDLPAGQELEDLPGEELAISPDGARIAYVVRQAGILQTYLRPLDSLQANPIPGTEGGSDPFFSPDGQWLGFFADGRLKKVSLSGGAPVTLADVTSLGAVGGEWNSQGTIVFGGSITSVQQVSDAGGTPQPLTQLEKGEIYHLGPDLLPGGAAVLFAVGNGSGTGRAEKVVVQSLPNGERRDLVPSGMQPHYVSSGYLVYGAGGNIMAAHFDPRRLALTSAAVPVVEGVLDRSDGLASDFALSSTGSLVYVPGFSRSQLNLVWVDRAGKEQPASAPTHNYVFPRISPDGKRVTAGVEEADSQIWVYDLGRDTLTRLTFQGDTNVDPIWTPDGKRIVFKGAQNRLFWQPADGSSGAEELTSSELGTNNIPGSWSPDGQELIFSLDNTAGRNTWILPLKEGKPRPLLPSPVRYETAPRLSPDGHWVAYASTESGKFEIYVRPYPRPGGKWQISNEGGTEPVWNPKGGELFYRNGQKMMAVDYTEQPAFSAGKPHVLFEGPYVKSPRSFPDYDVSFDGQRFLMLKPVARQQERSQIVVVQNWFEELKQKVPTGKK